MNSETEGETLLRILSSLSGKAEVDRWLYEADVRVLWRYFAEGNEAEVSNLEDLVVATLWTEIAVSQDELVTGLQILEGVWRLDVTEATARSLLLCVVLAGYLVLRGASDLDIALLSGVLSYFASIDRVELTESDVQLLVILTRNQKVLHARDIHEMYRHAPTSLRRRMTESEFGEYITRLTHAGYADDKDGVLTITQQAKFRIEFR
jgi:hypothetical protein